MAASGDSYHRLLAEFRKRDVYDSVFRSTVDDLVGRVNLDVVRSCVAFGTGSGEHELEFTRRLLPNLRTFLAVDPDHQSVDALRHNFHQQLPCVETTALETTVEEWSGLEPPVDIAMLFNILFHVPPAVRRQLFQTLTARSLNPDGYVVIVENESSDASGFMRLMKVLGHPEYKYKDVEDDMLAAGFRLVLTVSIVGKRDLSNPTEDVVKYLKTMILTHSDVSEEQLRRAIEQVFSQPEMRVFNKRLAIFQK